MRKSILLIYFLLIASSVSIAQDQLRLKDGSLISGDILNYKKNEVLKIRLVSGDTLTIQGIGMQTISTVTIGQSFKGNMEYLDYSRKPIFGIFMGGTLDQEYNSLLVGGRIGLQGGYSFTHYLETSIAVGYESYDQVYLITTDLVISGDFFKNNITPFYEIRLGDSNAKHKELENDFWGEDMTQSASSGFRLNPAIGINFKHSSAQYRISFGYLSQEISMSQRFIDWQSNPAVNTTKRQYRRGTITLTILI